MFAETVETHHNQFPQEWSAAEELELIGCESLKEFAQRIGRTYHACKTRRSLLLSGKRQLNGSEKARARKTITTVEYQRSDEFRLKDEAFVRALKAEAIRLGLVKITEPA